MADHDKTPEEPKPAEPASIAAAPPPRGAGPKSEWTASDDRGPLERAGEGDEGATPPPETGAAAPVAAHPAAAPVGPLVDEVPAGAPASADATPVTAAEPAVGATTAPASEARKPGRSLWPVAAAVVLGAVIGAGSAYIDGRYFGAGASGPDVESLTARVDALEKRPDPQPAIGEIRSSVTALANKVAALQGSAGPGGQSAAPAQAPTPAPEKSAENTKPAETSQSNAPAPTATPAVDLGPLNQKITALRADLDTLKTQGADTKALQEKVAALEGALAGMKTATAAAQAGVTTVEGEQKALAGRVMVPALAVVADSLVQQIDQGLPYAAQVEALVSLGVDPAKVAVLRENADKGVPSAKALAARFEPLAEPIATIAHKAPANAGFMDRLKSGMLSLVSIRRADDTSGDDLPSRVARIKASLAHDDVPGAVAAWNALPDDARSKSAAWGALAKTSADAITAARALQHDAIVALGAKKS